MADTMQIDSSFDIQGYIRAYGPRGRVNRLIALMDRNPEMKIVASSLLANEAPKIMEDDLLYTRIFRLLAQIDPSVSMNEGQLEESKKKVKDLTHKLDEDVQRWRNLNKDENARIAYVDLASHFEKQGKYELACTKYMEAYEFADTHFQQIQLRILICKAAILGNTWVQIKQYAPHLLESSEFRSTLSQFEHQHGVLMVCLGLYYLHKGQYVDAAQYLVNQPCSSVTDYLTNIISAEHLGLYGALTAVVAFNRGQFEARVIRNKVFQTFLQQSSKAKALVNAYFSSNYKAVNVALEDIKDYLKLDFYCRDQYRDFISAVRGKAMVQFFSPYSNMTMQNMSEEFGVSLEAMETELVTCISQGHINARINSKDKTVTAVEVDEEAQLFNEIKSNGVQWTRETKAMLLRMSMVRRGVALNPASRSRSDDDDDNFLGNVLGASFFRGGRR